MKKLSMVMVLALVMTVVAGCGGEVKEKTSMEIDKTKKEIEDGQATDNGLESKVMAYFANMPDHIYKIKQDEFVERVKKGDDMVVLDIRQKADYDKGHAQGAINLPWGTAISDHLKYIPQDKEVMVYCYSGQTAGQAVMTLNVAGINARSVNLGWNFGISKVEGVADITSTEETKLEDKEYQVDSAVQKALDTYYAGLADVKETKFMDYKVSEDDLKAMIEAGDDFYLLSVRSEKDYQAGHIKGAKLIPWGKGMQAEFDTVPKDKKVVVYCYTGQTAGQATAGLRLLGVDAVSLNGGAGMPINAPLGWTNKGYELVQD